MRGGKRRRSPPPAGRRGEDRRLGANGGYPPGNFRERRPRSISPEPRYRRSPPPFNKRYRREEEPYDRYGRGPDSYDRRGGYGRERFDEDPYGPPPPYGRRFPSPPLAKREPLAYKEFMLRLADDVTPEDAQREYQRYLAEYWGSQTRAEFQAKHREPWMRRKYDLREQLKALKERNAGARAAAADFAQALASGGIDPKAPGFNQGEGGATAAAATLAHAEGGEANGAATLKDEGTGEGEEKAELPAKKPEAGSRDMRASAPEVCWKAERLEADLALAKQLMVKVDAEKGIEGNPVDEYAAAAQLPEAPAAEGAEDQEGAAKEAPKKGYEEIVALLDLHLTYLWRVHGVDFYAGAELADPDAYAARLEGGRLLRGPRPEEGEQAADGAESKELKALEEVVDTVWKKRLEDGDPFEAGLGKERVHVQLEEWVEDQVTRIEDNKWGCKLSQKLFVGKEYVLKHIRLKHAQTMEAKREEIYDKIYYENFERSKKEEEERAREEAQRAQQAAWGGGPGGPPGWNGGPPPPGWEGAGWEGGGDGFVGDGFAGGAPLGWAGGGAGMAFPPNRAGSGFGEGGSVVPGPLPMGAPAIGPGQMLVLAPGAGPLGPFISVPIPEGGAVALGAPPGGPRGPSGGGMRGRGPPRGRGRGGFGPPGGGYGGPMMGGGRRGGGYYDLDAPENQRSVLDYGDL